MNNDDSKFWWRTSGGRGGGEEKNTETIRFDGTQVIAPPHFGLARLLGGDLVIWKWEETAKPASLELHWLRDIGCAAPVWTMAFKPGETREVRFQLLMVRGASRYDNIEKNWVFAYVPVGNMLRVFSMPLCNEERLSLNVSVTGPHGTSIINNRREMAGTTPLTPGRMNYRVASQFVSGERYKLQLQMDSLKDSSRLLEVSGQVQP